MTLKFMQFEARVFLIKCHTEQEGRIAFTSVLQEVDCFLQTSFAMMRSTEKFRVFLFSVFVLLASVLSLQSLSERPRIVSKNGHLTFLTPRGKNISFQSTVISFNDKDVSRLFSGNSRVSSDDLSSHPVILDIIDRLDSMESRTSSSDSPSSGSNSGSSLNDIRNTLNQLLGSGSDRLSASKIRKAIRSVRKIKQKVDQLTKLLSQNECESNPCRNGGTCFDSFNGFRCECPLNFEGLTCEADVNECSKFQGTSLGCQNGATCVNTHGGYQCQCQANFYGIHCSERHDDCMSASNEELCGHGTCINQQRVLAGQPKYTCICDAGWTRSDSSPACSVDIDECTSKTGTPVCSTNPIVQCINIPGSFMCGSCPHGFTGNGKYCHDIDECASNNGGCSVNPKVDCINTHGSFRCGSCPAGYAGDGTSCTYSGICSMNNGGCSPIAQCRENPAISLSYRDCICPLGYIGSGIGSYGCVDSSSGSSCSAATCLHGVCVSSSSSGNPVCVCDQGWEGVYCQNPSRAIATTVFVGCNTSNPCLNGGTCTDYPAGQLTANEINGVTEKSYICICPFDYRGTNCESVRDSCGGTFNTLSGVIQFPVSSQTNLYAPEQNCAWRITLAEGSVINATFISFDVEPSVECNVDFVQINDGPDASSHVIGKYCGSRVPPNILSTHNSIYIWFRSDSTVHGNGFTLEWNSAEAVCGDVLPVQDFGSLASPGYPGRYPNNRTCFWLIRVPFGKRITLNFATVSIESHATCDYDYLKVYDGAIQTDPVLVKVCNTSLVPPITSSGSQVLVEFHSDAVLADIGFHLTYSSTQGIPGCGGLITGDKGVIYSPNFPDVYTNNIECDWIIRVHPNEKVSIRIKEFDLEKQEKCDWDFLEIKDGMSETSPLIGRYCGSVFPTKQPLMSTGHGLFIRFRADASFAGKGFKLEYQTECGGIFEGTEGVIKSPFYPDYYPANRECRYLIRVPLNHVVSVEFLSFEVEGSVGCIYDYVDIREGGSEHNNSFIGRFCGSAPPEPFISMFNEVLFIFKTDGSEHNKGFFANYSSMDVGCGGVLSQNHGHFSSPNDEVAYKHKASCNWLIRAPLGLVIRLTFPVFGIEFHPNCTFDYIEINDVSGYSLGKFCGSSSPPSVQSFSNEITVTFKSDESHSAEGFTISYVFINESLACGGNYFAETGMIQSPLFPEHYPPNKDCVWTINAENNHQIHLNFTFFQIENQTRCDYDFLEIRNGAEPTSPLLGRFCGFERNVLPKDLISHSNHLWLRFKSDTSQSAKGFQLYYDTASNGCGGTLTAFSGIIESPNYPSPYGHNADCLWTIKISQGSLVELTVIDMDLEEHHECMYDFVEFFDGRNEFAPLLGYICSASSAQSVFKSSSNYLSVRFRTDVSKSGRGFKLSYRTNCIFVTTEQRRGVIESPNFPSKYPNNFNCSWRIEAPIGNNITFAFTHFDIETGVDENTITCEHDRLEFHEYFSSRKFCGTKLVMPLPFNTSSNVVTVNFTSDFYVAQSGFRLEWMAVGCGGDFIGKTKGTITSPNYPHGYPHNTVCIWNIRTEVGTAIELRFSDFDMESSEDCRYDSVQIYSGEDFSTAVKFGEYCHKIAPSQLHVIPSSSNTMTLKFASDSTVSGRGFSASWRVKRGGCSSSYIKAEKGSISSPKYPSSFDANTVCNYYINTSPLHKLEMTLDDLSLPSSVNCSESSLMITDGYFSTQKELLKTCGNTLPDQPIISESTSTSITLKSILPAKGFKLSFKTICGGIRELSFSKSGTFTSPNYPYGSLNMLSCNWTFVSNDPSDRIVLTFPRVFGTAAEYDDCENHVVVIKDGKDPESPVLGKICKNETPLPFISTGHAVRVEMIGVVVFRAMYSTSLSSCGGTTLTSNQGSFVSPGYPNNYPPNIECIWLVKAPQGNRVFLKITSLDIQENEYCNTDYLEIREASSDGKLIGRFCGKNPPLLESNHTSESNIFYVKFKTSDAESTGKGFFASFRLVHGVSLTGESGVIESPGYPWGLFLNSDYKDFVWNIMTPSGTFAAITFDTLELSEGYEGDCYQFVSILDGTATSDTLDSLPVLGTYCGLSVPTEKIVGHSNVITVVYNPRDSYRGKFVLRWESLSYKDYRKIVANKFIDQRKEMLNNRTNNECIEHLFMNHSNSLTIESPGYPYGYPDNFYCSWMVNTKPGFHYKIKVLDMNLEGREPCYYDRLSIFEEVRNSTVQFALKKKWCSRMKGEEVEVFSSRVKLTFQTDSFYNYTGFRISVERICGGNLFATSGVISNTFNHSTILCDNSTWNINVRNGRTIRFKLTDLSLINSDTSCSQSYLIIKNGMDIISSPFLGQGRFCGSNIVSIPDTSSNHAVVQYVVSEVHPISLTGKFTLEYEEISTDCGGTITLSEEDDLDYDAPKKFVEISSPNYPAPPPHDVVCDWTIIAPNHRTLRMEFADASIATNRQECSFNTEYLQINDGGTVASPSIHSLCLPIQETEIRSFKTSQSMMFLRFATNGSFAFSTFKVKVSIDECGGTYYVDFHERINGPIEGSDYNNGMECIYYVKTKAIYSLSVASYYSTNIDIKNEDPVNCTRGDFLEIRDTNEAGDLLGKFCATQTITDVTSESNILYLRFKSDYIGVGKGFDLSFNVNFRPCGGDVEDTQGTLTSPSFPSAYPFPRKCTWRFKVPRDKAIKLSFQVLNLKTHPRNPNQCIDKLIVQRKYLRMIRNEVNCSQENEPEDITISGNVDLILETRGLAANEGFKLTYSEQEDVDCGGLMTLQAGDLISPGNEVVASNASIARRSLIECSWKIFPGSSSDGTIVSSGNQRRKTLGLYFDIFEVPYPSETTYGYGCMYGILAVGEARVSRWHSTPSYGLCGNKTNSNFFLTFPYHGDPYYVSLLMNQTQGWRGIRGRYSVQDCGGEFNVYSTMNITSPGYPNGYPPNTLCSWTFRFYEGNVQLEFTDFDMEGTENKCDQDYVKLEAGTYVGSPVIATLCGSYSGKIFKSRSVIVVSMKTDSNGSKKGFSLQVTKDENACGGHFKFPMMDIKSPNFPSDYPNNVECIWTIEEDPTYKLLFTYKDRFDIEMDRSCSKDYVKIQEYFNNDWLTISHDCGHERPNSTITSRSHIARVVFRSNENITASGFKLHYQIICGGILQSPEGVITSPNYPDAHPPGSKCEWVISRPNDFIVFNFDDFVMEGGPPVLSSGLTGCAYDSVAIFKSNNTASPPEYGPFCGQMSDSMKQDFISKDYMTIKMNTDESLNYRGFKARYRVFSCGGQVNDTSFGIIASPDLPPSFQSGINCTWVINARENKALQLKFSKSTLKPCFQCSRCDSVEIRDGNNESSPLIEKFCDKLDPRMPMIFKSSSNSLWIRFVQNQPNVPYTTMTRTAETAKGTFELVYKTTAGERQGCGGVYRHRSKTNLNPQLNSNVRIIASPDSDQDGNYDSDVDCNWVLMSTEGTYFSLNFEYFDLETADNATKKCDYDFLEIRDGGEESSPVIDKMCGKSYDPVIVSSTEKLFIHFHSDSGVEARGFKINFSVKNVSCGGKISVINSTQVITSPNFPSSYAPLLRCRWHFVIDNRWMNKVSLNFTVHEIDCDNEDKIEFAFARGDYNPYRMCGRTLPPRLIGPNDLWMTFATGDKKVDSSFRGFKLQYEVASCNETYRTNNGVITSPNFPLKRSLEKYCLIKIEVEKGRMISLFFHDFDVSSSAIRRGQSNPCSEAGVEVREGLSMTSPLLASFCGATPPDPVFSTSNQLLLYVKAPRSHYYSMMYTSSLTPGCGGNITAFNGTFTSPWFPNKYNSDTPCLWSLSSLGHHSMTLTFSRFDLTPTPECSSNYLEIFEGLQDDVSRRFARYCGQVSISVIFLSNIASIGETVKSAKEVQDNRRRLTKSF